MTDIFLSYSSVDRPMALAVRAALEAEGLAVFLDQETPVGEDWNAWIGRHLAASKVAVVLWSPASVQSANVVHEATIAKNSGKLLPAVIADLAPEQFPMGFYTVQGADLRGFARPPHAGFARLAEAIRARLTPLGAAPPPKQQPVQPAPATRVEPLQTPALTPLQRAEAKAEAMTADAAATRRKVATAVLAIAAVLVCGFIALNWQWVAQVATLPLPERGPPGP